MKMRVLFFVAIIALTLFSCTQQNGSPPTITETTSLTTTEITEQIVTLPDPLPLPEAILLVQSPEYEWADGEDIKYIHRFVYYNVPWKIYVLRDDDGFGLSDADGFGRSDEGGDFHYFAENPEMALISFIKHYKIKKDNFVEALQQEYEWHMTDKFYDIYAEDFELPNADIIYTFDNEIINAYYRRENPVAPEPGTYRTYGSYEEYLKANR